MFEAQVAWYLNNYLGKYLSGLDAESLKISVWKGDVQLRNLHLKPEALNGLDLPVTVKAGLLGKLTLKVRAADPSQEAYMHGGFGGAASGRCQHMAHGAQGGPHFFTGAPDPSAASLWVPYRCHGPL